MKINEITAGQVANTADTVGTVAGYAQTGADVAKAAGKIAPNIISKATKLAPRLAGQASKVAPMVQKFIPGVGMVASGADAVRRASAGDWGGAGLAAASGLASMVPIVGTAASLGLTGYQAYRDHQRTGSWSPDVDQIAAASGKTAQDGFNTAALAAKQPAQMPIQQAARQPIPKAQTNQTAMAEKSKVSERDFMRFLLDKID